MPIPSAVERKQGASVPKRRGFLVRAHRLIAGDPHKALMRAANVAQRSRTVGRITSRPSREEMLKKSEARSRKGVPVRKPLKR